MIRPRGCESFTVKGPPEGGDRQHAGCVAGVNVMWGVSDEYGPVRCGAEAFERDQHWLRIGLVPFRLVEADDDWEMTVEPDPLQAASGDEGRFAGHNAERISTLGEPGDDRRHVVVAA